MSLMKSQSIFNELLEKLIFGLVIFIQDLYQTEYSNGNVTSISNFLKIDKMYTQSILEKYIIELKKRDNFDRLIDFCGDLFRRQLYGKCTSNIYRKKNCLRNGELDL